MTSSILTLNGLSRNHIERIFTLARQLKKSPLKPDFAGQFAALLFFEPSTRTRLSFEAACHRAGIGPMVFQAGQGTSMEKGETLEDSVANVVAMNPSILVVRAGDELKMESLGSKLSIPVINAGWGKKGHPTQALLDLLTISERRPLDGVKVVFLGDLLYSRVAASHLEVWPQFNGEVRFCGPKELVPPHQPGEPVVQTFSNVDEAIEWADVIVALRYQTERHGVNSADPKKSAAALADIRANYALTAERLKKIPSSTLILHPGPVNHGVEIDSEVYFDSRSVILDQVSHGVWLREALLRLLLKGDLT